MRNLHEWRGWLLPKEVQELGPETVETLDTLVAIYDSAEFILSGNSGGRLDCFYELLRHAYWDGVLSGSEFATHMKNLIDALFRVDPPKISEKPGRNILL